MKPPPMEPALAEITVESKRSVVVERVVEEKAVVVEEVEEVELSQLEVSTSSLVPEVANSHESMVAWESGEEVRQPSHLHTPAHLDTCLSHLPITRPFSRRWRRWR